MQLGIEGKHSGCRMTGGICACRSGGSFGGCARERTDCCTNEPGRAISAPTAAERRSIGEDHEFHRLLTDCECASRPGDPRDPADTMFALIRYIDTWAARSADPLSESYRGFDAAWEREVAANGGVAIGADYRHWMQKGWAARSAAEAVPEEQKQADESNVLPPTRGTGNQQDADARDAAQWRELLACVMREMPQRFHHEDGNAPGHGHSKPGIWDRYNGEKSGTECAWCKVWNAARRALSADPAPGNTAHS